MMLDVLHQAETVAPFKASVLVTGETGTGKELLARFLHEKSPRQSQPLVALNCAAVPEQLLEDELFGHVKGAFTGANTERKGRFEQADGGTLFLDEVGDMNPALQSKLLRVLQESEFERLGSSKTVKVDVRVVAATSADLEKKIESGDFRADLFHRLNVVRLAVPPLRQRREDILPLAEYLMKRFSDNAGLPAKTLGGEAEKILLEYDFPGNVRQLQNCVERAAIFSGMQTVIEPEHLSDEIRRSQSTGAGDEFFQVPTTIPDEGLDFSGFVTQVEKNLLLQTLDKTQGNKMQAARLLNMKRTTLVEKLKRLNIESDTEDEGENN
jgi:transcriptional regulator with GAF, ATPase, and Fis domain